MNKPTTSRASRDVFAVNLMLLMTKKGVTVPEMTHDLSLGKYRIRGWLKRQSFPTHEMMVELCHYFDYFDIYKLVTCQLSSNEIDS